MKKVTLIISCALLIAGAAQATDAKWLARTQKAYGWTGSRWMLDETYSIAYNSAGQVMTQTVTDSDRSVSREKNTWNANGMLATRVTEYAQSSAFPFQQSQRLTRTYDDRLTSFITFNDQLLNQNGNWVPSNNYTQTITRDDNGNITLMERAVYFQGIYDPTFRLHVTYDDKGIATEITTEDLNYDYATQEYFWKPGNSYRNIQWESTDGQIVSIENLYEGANRIKQADAIISGNEYRIYAEYGEDGSWTAHHLIYDPEMDMDLEEKTEFTPFDEYGSCRLVTTMAYIYGDTSFAAESLTQEYRFDPNGLILLEEITYDDGDEIEILNKVVGEVTYDAENGYPLAWTLAEFDNDSETLVNVFHAEYSDYIQISESALPQLEAAETGAQFFNLLGQPVKRPAPGSIVIKSDAGGARKIKF